MLKFLRSQPWIGGRSGKLTPLILPSFFRTTLAVAEVQPPSFLAISAIEIPYSRLKIHEHRSPAMARPGCECRFLYPGLLKERRSLAGPGYPERSACLRFLESSHGAGFQERLIGLDEAWLFSSKPHPNVKCIFSTTSPFHGQIEPEKDRGSREIRHRERIYLSYGGKSAVISSGLIFRNPFALHSFDYPKMVITENFLLGSKE